MLTTKAGNVLSVGLVVAVVVTLGQGKPKARGELMPMFQLVKQAGFPVVQVQDPMFTFSRAELNTLPQGFAGIKKSQNIAYVTYGYRKGGLVRLYETPAIPGVTNEHLMKLVAASGIFHDSYKDPNFHSDSLTRKGVVVLVDSIKPEVLKLAMATLRAGH